MKKKAIGVEQLMDICIRSAIRSINIQKIQQLYRHTMKTQTWPIPLNRCDVILMQKIKKKKKQQHTLWIHRIFSKMNQFWGDEFGIRCICVAFKSYVCMEITILAHLWRFSMLQLYNGRDRAICMCFQCICELRMNAERMPRVETHNSFFIYSYSCFFCFNFNKFTHKLKCIKRRRKTMQKHKICTHIELKHTIHIHAHFKWPDCSKTF